MYYFIVNPNSRSGKALGIWEKLKKRLEHEKISYEAHLTKYPGHAIELAAMLTSPKHPDHEPKTIVALGGDGTLNEVMNGLSVTSSVTLGYIPSGSGNDFSRGMNLSRNPDKALTKLLTSAQCRCIDYGILSYLDAHHHPAHRRFAVSAGAGYDANVCENLFTSKLKKIFNQLHVGKLVYLLIGIKQIALSKSSDGMLVLDGSKRIPLKRIRFISFHIQKYEGGGFCFAPKADPTDGYLDLCVVSGVSRLGLLWILAASLVGKHTLCNGVRTYACKEAVLHLETPLCLHGDGETFGMQTDISVRCEEKKIRFLC